MNDVGREMGSKQKEDCRAADIEFSKRQTEQNKTRERNTRRFAISPKCVKIYLLAQEKTNEIIMRAIVLRALCASISLLICNLISLGCYPCHSRFSTMMMDLRKRNFSRGLTLLGSGSSSSNSNSHNNTMRESIEPLLNKSPSG